MILLHLDTAVYTVSMPDHADSLMELIGLPKAAKLSRLTHDHLRRVAREGKLQAIKVGRDWLTTKKALNTFLASDRKPGRKSRI